MDLDVWEIIELASTKPYGFMPFFPGPGIGGTAFPSTPFTSHGKHESLTCGRSLSNYRAN